MVVSWTLLLTLVVVSDICFGLVFGVVVVSTGTEVKNCCEGCLFVLILVLSLGFVFESLIAGCIEGAEVNPSDGGSRLVGLSEYLCINDLIVGLTLSANIEGFQLESVGLSDGPTVGNEGDG